MRAEIVPKELHLRALSLCEKGADDDIYAKVYMDAGWLTIDNGEHLPVGEFQKAVNWATGLFVYEQSWRTHGRRPRENTRDRSTLPADERRLGGWARYQKRFEYRLTEFQRTRLTVSPAFAWDPTETDWANKMAACDRHVDCTHRLPFRNPDDLEEYVLARWLERQLLKLKAGTLSAERAVRIEALLALVSR